MFFRILILVHMCAAFPLKCPEPAQWSIRARGLCPDPSKYFCLKNDLINGFSENCSVFDFHQPGRKSVLRGGLDADIRSEERYHPWPIKFYTNVSTGCIFLKSACNEEGQVLYGNGNRHTDISCRCDYTRGYDFLVKPRNPCFCLPAEEDCLCYVKTCVDSKYMLSPDYQCIHVMNTSVAHCKPILNERLNRQRNREENQNQTQDTLDLTRKENISPPARWTIIVGITVTGLFFEHLAKSRSDEMEIGTSKKQLAKSVREEIEIMNFKRKRKRISDFMVDTLGQWQKDDNMYITTKATEFVLGCIEKHNCVSVIGPSGSGKTALVRHVALQLERNDDYTIISVTDAREIKEQYESKRKTLYIVDDMCGNFTANHDRLEEWKKSKGDITNTLKFGYCKLIITCRLQVFQDEEFSNLEIFKICECNLTSDGLSLTSNEKEKMTEMYFKEHASEALLHLGQYEFLPLLCRLYDCQRDDPKFKLDFFFKDPFAFYEQELTEMLKDSKQGTFKCCALLLIVIYNNKLGEKKLTEKDAKMKKIIREIREVCEIKVTDRKLKTQLKILEGTFVTYDKGIYHTIHDKMFDFLASHFGKQDKFIDILIKHGTVRFICERFVTSKKNVMHDNESGNYLIFISENKLQMYMKRVFGDMVGYWYVPSYIHGNINFENIEFCNMFLDLMKNLSNHEIIALIETASTDFLSKMFVMSEIDIDDRLHKNAYQYLCFGIILPRDILPYFIDRYFRKMIGARFFTSNRLSKSVTFYLAMRTYMRQLDKEQISSLIQYGSSDFVNEMFVMTESDIENDKCNSFEISKTLGIVIPDDLIQQYVHRWFKCLTNENLIEDFTEKNRPLLKVKFRTAMGTYMREFNEKKIASLIQNVSQDFLCKMFVMKEDDIKENIENRYECLGIVIHDAFLQEYIVRWFNCVSKSYCRIETILNSRPLMNASFRAALNIYMRTLKTETIAYIIQHCNNTCFDSMFVMAEEDIKKNDDNRYECFGIVISEELIVPYIEKWFKNLTKYCIDFKKKINENRLFSNAKFCTALQSYIRQLHTDKISSLIHTASKNWLCKMFVVSENDIIDCQKNRYKCFGIVIPKDLIQQYIEKWFEYLIKSCYTDKMNKSRPLMNASFRTTLRTYVREFSKEKIESIIRTGSEHFIETMFIVTEDDIKKDEVNLSGSFRIVLPNDLLQLYVEKWLQSLVSSFNPNMFLKENILYTNVSFRMALWNYIRQLNVNTITNRFGSDEFLYTMFVMAENDIENNANSQCESEDIVIFNDLLQPFIKMWLTFMKEHYNISQFIKDSSLLMNARFRTALQTNLRELNTASIASLIQTEQDDFLLTMFVTTKDELRGNAANQYGCFGIVIPDDLLQLYIERWFKSLKKINGVEQFIKRSRPLTNASFCTAVQTYLRLFDEKQITSLIQNGNLDFLSLMFVITENDIKSNSENRYENFGIVIIDDMIPHFIKKWFECLTQAVRIKDFLNKSRFLTNIAFRKSLRDYIRQFNSDQIDVLMNTGSSAFINTMFVMKEHDIKDNSEKRYEYVGIVVPNDVLQQFIGRWFDNFTKTASVAEYINESRLLKNVTGRAVIQNYLSQTTEATIETLIQTSSNDFFRIMFVMIEDDIKDNAVNQYRCFGIVLSDDLLHQYIGRLFRVLTNAYLVKEYFTANRCFTDVKFQIALQTFTKQLTTKEIGNLMRTGSTDFVNTMFVMTENDIIENSENLLECFGIIIPADLLPQYVKKWFDGMEENDYVIKYIDANRCLFDFTFRIALQTYTKQLTTENIGNLILMGSTDFVNTMFVMTENDIKENSENRLECFGIIIPADLLPQYIERWFDGMTENDHVNKYIYANRCFKDITFQIALQAYRKQLTTENIGKLIRTGSRDFVNTMFVMKENDINKNSDNRLECFGIIIPDDLLSQYIGRFFVDMTKTDSEKEYIDAYRCLMDTTFRKALQTYTKQLTTGNIETLIRVASRDFVNTMFVMKGNDIKENSENQFKCVGIVIPEILLLQYIERWFDSMTKTDSVNKYIDDNWCLFDVTYREALQTFTKQLTTGNIRNLIWTGSIDFVNTMFVMTENVIKDNTDNQIERVGIVIPDEFLMQYIERWFNGMTEIDSVYKYIDANRCLTDITFRIALQTYTKQLNTRHIRTLIRIGSIDFLNTMFVMTENDIKENSENRLECFGIIIPEDLLPQYIERWFDGMTEIDYVYKYIDANRCLTDITFRIALQTYIKQLTTRKIGTLIRTASKDFLNTMFVIKVNDIKENSDNRFERIGINIPEDLILQYIGIWFDGLTKTDSVYKYIDANRCLTDITFRIALQTYTKQLSSRKIGNLILTGSTDFVNKMFVLTERNIKENSENRNECFGIVLPEECLQQYVERWLDGFTKTDSAMQYIDTNRTFMNSKFQTPLDSYLNGINAHKIELLNQKGNIDYLNRRRDLFKESSISEINS